MYITVGETQYTNIKNLVFAPRASMTVDELPINEFSADIMTTDNIAEGQWAWLKDDLDVVWAKYWVYRADRMDEKTVHLAAHSEIALLEYVTLPEKVYKNESLEKVVEECMVRQSGAEGITAAIDYRFGAALTGKKISGYCPEQTARERLQWACFVAGAFVRTFFNERPAVRALDKTVTLIPRSETFWKPTVNMGRRVTAIKATAWTFTKGEETQNDILDSGSYSFPLPWIADTQQFSIANPETTLDDGDNAVEVEELYLVNSKNVYDVMTRLSGRYFPRESVDVDVINNGKYKPGDKVTVYDDENHLHTGVVESCEFSFGLQARARLHVCAAESMEAAELIIDYTYNGRRINREKYTLPVDMDYEIQTQYIDKTGGGIRRVYRPTTDSVTGTLTGAGATVEVPLQIALQFQNGKLSVYDVDGVSVNDNNIAVIE